MSQQFANNASAVLAASITDSETSITVAEAKNIPALEAGDYFLATLFLNSNPAHIEVVKVTGVTGNTWQIEREQEGTSPLAHDINTPIELRLTKGTLESILQLINQIDLSALIDDAATAGNKTFSSNKVSQLLAQKQSTLVSGQSLKTIGGVSLLGEGDIPSGEIYYKEFLSSGIWNKPENATNVLVEAISAGGDFNQRGEVHRRLISADDCSDTEIVTVGSQPIGSSSFGDLVTAKYGKISSPDIFRGGMGGLAGYSASRYDPLTGNTDTTAIGEDSTKDLLGGGGGRTLDLTIASDNNNPYNGAPYVNGDSFEHDGYIYVPLQRAKNCRYLAKCEKYSQDRIIDLIDMGAEVSVGYGLSFTNGKLVGLGTNKPNTIQNGETVIFRLYDMSIGNMTYHFFMNTTGVEIPTFSACEYFDGKYYLFFGTKTSSSSTKRVFIFSTSDFSTFDHIYTSPSNSGSGSVGYKGGSNSSGLFFTIYLSSDRKALADSIYIYSTDGMTWNEQKLSSSGNDAKSPPSTPVVRPDGAIVFTACWHSSYYRPMFFWTYDISTLNSVLEYTNVGINTYPPCAYVGADSSGVVYGMLASTGASGSTSPEANMYALKTDNTFSSAYEDISLSQGNYCSLPKTLDPSRLTVFKHMYQPSSPYGHRNEIVPFAYDGSAFAQLQSGTPFDLSGLNPQSIKYPFFSRGGNGGIGAGAGATASFQSGLSYLIYWFEDNANSSTSVQTSFDAEGGNGRVRVWAW